MNDLYLNVFEWISEIGWEWRGVQARIWTCSDTKIDVSPKGKHNPSQLTPRSQGNKWKTKRRRGHDRAWWHGVAVLKFCLCSPRKCLTSRFEVACVQVEGWCNEPCFSLDYVWKRVSKGVIEETYESRMKNTKKIINWAHGFRGEKPRASLRASNVSMKFG